LRASVAPRALLKLQSKSFLANRRAEISFCVDVSGRDCAEQTFEMLEFCADRLDDDAAVFCAHIDLRAHGKRCGFHNHGGNAQTGAFSPFFDNGAQAKTPRIDLVDVKTTRLMIEAVGCDPLFRMAERVSPRKVGQVRAKGAPPSAVA
jgi:hypothetical protein